MSDDTSPVRGFALRSIGRNLVIRDGVIATRDGTPLATYLADRGFAEGEVVNLIRHRDMVRLDTIASCAGIG